jgi:hypothetical protein
MCVGSPHSVRLHDMYPRIPKRHSPLRCSVDGEHAHWCMLGCRRRRCDRGVGGGGGVGAGAKLIHLRMDDEIGRVSRECMAVAEPF